MTIDKDYAGILLSSLCLLHCLAGPIILMLGFSTVGYSFFLDEKIHLALVFPIVLFAVWSIPNGLRSHKKTMPILIAALGVQLLLLGLIIESMEVMLTFSASTLLIFAHITNKKYLINV